MKKIYTTIIVTLATIQLSHAQWIGGLTGAAYYNSSNGFVGIGTSTPLTAFQIGDLTGGEKLLSIPGTYNFEQVRLGQLGNGDAALEFVNHNGASASYGIKLLVDVDHGAPGLQFQYAPPANSYSALSYTTGMYLNTSGYVGIGTTSPDAKLAVKGTIHTQEVKVDMIGWGDYVFDKDYPLKSLSSVKTYINQHHHLPEIPSEAEVVKNGVNVGEMLKLQTKKIEELTLYLIDKDKQLSEQNAKLADQQKKNDAQEARIVALEKALLKNTHKK